MQEFKKVPATKKSIAQRKLVYGVGVNDAWYMTQIMIDGKTSKCSAYSAWKDMLGRCYSKKLHKIRPTYINCEVCNEWWLFSNFALWHKENYIAGFELDKDIKIKGNKVYSPDACLFIPPYINKLLTNSGATRGNLPIGVSYKKANCKFQSQISINGRGVYLGVFENKDLAHDAYNKAKNEQIELAMKDNAPISMYLKQHICSDK